MRCDCLSIRALHPESLVDPSPKKCVVVAQRPSTFDNDVISRYQRISIFDWKFILTISVNYIQYRCEPKLANGAFLGSFFVAKIDSAYYFYIITYDVITCHWFLQKKTKKGLTLYQSYYFLMVRTVGIEPTWLPIRPSNVRVYQFRHVRN